ncbi:MAG TPA: gliding motility lipoprotein GldH [Cyclobacteriaceae bacterium]
MRIVSVLFLLALLMSGCDKSRVFEKNKDLKDQSWLVVNKPVFEFQVDNTPQPYNLYCNIRNEVSYPKANIYFSYNLTDSSGNVLESKLISHMLFDKKTGKPFGTTGLGDIYDHQIPLLKNYSFKNPGKYKVTFEQFMRIDTLPGILAVGLRVEKSKMESKD